MLSVGELTTAVQHQPPIVVCLFNDSGYQMLRTIEARRGDGMLHGVDLAAPAFDEAFARAVRHRGPTLIDIDIDMHCLIPISR